MPRYYTENPREDKLHGLLRYCNVKVSKYKITNVKISMENFRMLYAHFKD